MVEFKHAHGAGVASAIIGIFLTDLISFFNVGKGMNHAQVLQTAELILEEFWQWKPEDFKLCFSWVKKGKYINSKLFDRVDGSIIITWMREYEDIKEQEIVNIRSGQSKEQTKFDNQQGLQILKELNQRGFITQQTQEQPVTKPEQRQRSTYENLIQLWMKQFDRRFEKYNVSVKGLKFIYLKNDKNKIPMSLQSWLEMKTKRYNKIIELNFVY